MTVDPDTRADNYKKLSTYGESLSPEKLSITCSPGIVHSQQIHISLVRLPNLMF